MQSERCSNIPFTFPNNNDREVELKATDPVFSIVHGANGGGILPHSEWHKANHPTNV
jgi:hypothetical protein